MNILVLYWWKHYPLRAWMRDLLYSFEHHSGARCCYVNMAVRGLPDLERTKFDLVICQASLFGNRWDRAHFERMTEQLAPLARFSGPKAIFPQDEYFSMDLICRFIERLGVTHVFSVAPQSEFPKIYAGVDPAKVHFERILTTYYDPKTLRVIERLATSGAPRDLDIGYRAQHHVPWIGRFGLLKHELAMRVNERGPAFGLKLDVSTELSDVIFGDAWYRFLARCKYVVGIEGGASLLDFDGTLQRKVQAYTAEHPDAKFEEIEANCFPGLDGNLALKAMSPRHLEACATRTCQVLVEGEYNGVLEPFKHYIPLKEDFSNLDEALALVKEDKLRAEIVANAYRDVVESGRYTQASLVKQVLDATVGSQARSAAAASGGRSPLAWRLSDRLSWVVLTPRIRMNQLRAWLKRKLPRSVAAAILAQTNRRRRQRVLAGKA